MQLGGERLTLSRVQMELLKAVRSLRVVASNVLL